MVYCSACITGARTAWRQFEEPANKDGQNHHRPPLLPARRPSAPREAQPARGRQCARADSVRAWKTAGGDSAGMAARGGGGCSHPGCGQQIGASEAAGAGLMRCTKCRQKVYCSKACQVAGWKGEHKQECERLREGAEAGRGGRGGAAAQEALRAALLGTTRRALTGRQEQVLNKMSESFNAGKDRQVVKMAEKGQAVAGEVRRARPDVAARIYCMLGHSFVQHFEFVQGLGLLEQARALAVESGDRDVLGEVCNSLGSFHHSAGRAQEGD